VIVKMIAAHREWRFQGHDSRDYYALFDFGLVASRASTLLGAVAGPSAPIYLSEDYVFCLRARELGFDPWTYKPAKLNHTI
jgi:hypothetical protein